MADSGVFVTNMGLLLNLTMAIAKYTAGHIFHSRAMIADAWHSATDLAADLVTLAAVSLSTPGAVSQRFPYGLGKVESLGGLAVSAILLAAGCHLGLESADALMNLSSGEAMDDMPDMNAAWVAGLTIMTKEWLYRATMRVAREKKSAVLASNASHHRIDGLGAVVTLLAIVGANASPDLAIWLDPLGGLLISLVVIHVGASNVMDALLELVDQSIDDSTKELIRSAATATDDEAHVRNVVGAKSGQTTIVELA